MPRFSKTLFVISVIAILAPAAYAGPSILVVGDSWAAGIVGFKAIEQVLEAHGETEVGVVGASTAIGGSRADQWAENQKGKLDILREALEADPSIAIVHISIGGNDFLRAAMENGVVTADPATREAVWAKIWADIEVMLKTIHEIRPDVQIVLNDYDYLDPVLMNKAYKLEFPPDVNAENLNEALVEFAQYKHEKVKTSGLCHYIQHFGLLQFHYGFPPHAEKHSVALPGMPPDYKPFAGGNPELANSPEAMPDGVHPMPEGYVYIMDRCYDAFYEDWLDGVTADSAK